MRPPAPAILLVLALLLIGLAPSAGLAQPNPSVPSPPSDEQTLQNAGLSATAPALLEFFRKRSGAVAGPERLRTLAGQLGDKKAAVRERAATDLVGWGPAAVPWLRQAANDPADPDAAERARQCLAAVEGPAGTAIVMAAIRVLAKLHPGGAAEALLAYLPFADDGKLVDETTEALRSVALPDDSPDPALRQALRDPVPLRRRVAGELLARGGGPAGREAARPLLHDPRPDVRMHVALALADAHEAEAVAALIGLLGEVPEEQARPAEDFLGQLAGEWAVKGPAGDDAPARRLRRDVWAAWWRALEPASLLDEFRKRALPDADVARARTLIRQLADPSDEMRDRARAGLLALGPGIAPLLRQAAEAEDGAGGTAARGCLQALADRDLPAPLPAAAARLLAVRKPDGAAAAMLAYLPLADETTAAEIEAALTVLAPRDGKLDPALAAALGDRSPARRAVAAEVVCRAGLPEQRALVRPLLKDPDAEVRLRASLALAGAREKEAVPVLIALLAELPGPGAEQAEDYLRQLADDRAPDATLGPDDAARRKCRDAWAAWWRDHGARAELPRLDAATRLRGYTLIVEMYNPTRRNGRVFEVDKAGKVRWSIDGLMGPADAQVLPGDRVLIAEQHVQRASERDFTGKVLWQQTVPNLLRCERLPNGQTLFVARDHLVVTDRAGKEVLTYRRPGFDVMNAWRLRDGQFALLTSNWQYVRLDAVGKERKTTPVAPFPLVGMIQGVAALPQDRLLVAEYQTNRVVERDLAGKVVWEAAVTSPIAVSRLPNGHTLVGGHNPQRVSELDRTGKVVWEYKENVWPCTVRRR
jgi:HEAT repeat protein